MRSCLDFDITVYRDTKHMPNPYLRFKNKTCTLFNKLWYSFPMVSTSNLRTVPA